MHNFENAFTGQEAAEGLGELSRILQADPGSNDDAKTEIDQLKNEVSRLKTSKNLLRDNFRYSI